MMDETTKLTAAIKTVNKALADFPFTSWTNDYIKSAIFTAIEALELDCDDPRWLLAIQSAIIQLQKQLGEQMQRGYEDQASTAQRIIMEIDGSMPDKPDVPRKMFWEAIKKLEARRMAARKETNA